MRIILKKEKFSILRMGLALLALVLFPMQFAPAGAEENIWTESVRSKDGLFAVSIDPAQKSIALLRADNRDLGTLHLRVVLTLPNSSTLSVGLKQMGGSEPPLKYSALVPEWDGNLAGFELQSSRDAITWKEIGRFRRGPLP